MDNKIIEQLVAIDDASTEDGVGYHYIEILKNDTEVVIKANKEGLVWLALQALKLAESGFEGKHIHIDECGMADRAETNLVISYFHEKSL